MIPIFIRSSFLSCGIHGKLCWVFSTNSEHITNLVEYDACTAGAIERGTWWSVVECSDGLESNVVMEWSSTCMCVECCKSVVVSRREMMYIYAMMCSYVVANLRAMVYRCVVVMYEVVWRLWWCEDVQILCCEVMILVSHANDCLIMVEGVFINLCVMHIWYNSILHYCLLTSATSGFLHSIQILLCIWVSI